MTKTCPICQSRQIRISKIVGNYQILRCEDCDLFWTPDVGDAELSDFYDRHYFEGSQEFGYAGYLKTEKAQRLNAKRLLATIAAHSGSENGMANTALLDVGCAYGFLIDEACRAGADAQGVDYSQDACRFAQTVLGRNVKLGGLHAANFPPGHFDVVTSIGSIEHMNDPTAMVDEVARITKPGGLFVVTTLDTKSPIRIYRFKPPEHLFYFSHSNLALLLNRKGFSIETVKANSAYHVFGEAFGLLTKALLGPRIDLNPLIKRMPWKDICLKLPNNEMLVVARRR